MTKSKRLTIISFGIFLGFMAVCTIIAKGIYTSGLPQVRAYEPKRTSLTHEITATGTIRQGTEYGIYVESGLRVASISVRMGDVFEKGVSLFQIDIDDLKDIIEEKELAFMKLNSQQKENLRDASRALKEQQAEVTRAKEDYEKNREEADILIQRSKQALEIAKEELRIYEQYLASTQESVSGGDQHLSRQEKLIRLKQNVNACAQALEDAGRLKDTNLLASDRVVEDAKNAGKSTYSSVIEINALELEYQQKQIEELKELLTAEGWVYAAVPGRLTSSRIAVGERTQDGASLLYALDNGERIVEAVFSWDQVKYLSIGDRFNMKVQLQNGSSIREDVTLNYMEVRTDGEVVGEIILEIEEIAIGQTAQLSCNKQTDVYETCINKAALYSNQYGNYYVYVAEEQDGILGTEWKVRTVFVTILDQNDRVAAIESAGITVESKIVMSSTKELKEGDTVRLLE